jgi:hypothetical protein
VSVDFVLISPTAVRREVKSIATNRTRRNIIGRNSSGYQCLPSRRDGRHEKENKNTKRHDSIHVLSGILPVSDSIKAKSAIFIDKAMRHRHSELADILRERPGNRRLPNRPYLHLERSLPEIETLHPLPQSWQQLPPVKLDMIQNCSAATVNAYDDWTRVFVDGAVSSQYGLGGVGIVFVSSSNSQHLSISCGLGFSSFFC